MTQLRHSGGDKRTAQITKRCHVCLLQFSAIFLQTMVTPLAQRGEVAMLSASEQAIAQATLAPGPACDRFVGPLIRDWNKTAEHIFGHSAGQCDRADPRPRGSRGGARRPLAQLPARNGDWLAELPARPRARCRGTATSLPSPTGRGALSGSQPSCARRTVISSREKGWSLVMAPKGRAIPSDETGLKSDIVKSTRLPLWTSLPRQTAQT
jgi:hypothetical protein